MTTPAELQSQIQQSNKRYFDAVESVPAATLESDQICGHWSARDVTLHLADWGDWLLIGIDQALNGGSPDDYPMADPEGFNDSQAETYGNVSWAEAKDRLNSVTVKASDLAGTLSAEQLEADATPPWGGSDSIGNLLSVFSQHQDAHVVELETLAE